MGNFLLALMLAAGASAFVYAKMGRRIGYGNGTAVWQLVGITFVMVFLIVFILLKTLVSLD